MSASASREGLVAALRARGALSADAGEMPPEGPHRPWFIALMLGLAGWLAGIFLLAFAVMFLEPKSSGAFLLLGLVLAALAWVLYFVDRKAVFFDQLALALSIAGQCAVAWSLLERVESAFVIFATLLGLQLVVLLVMPNKTARTLAALFATIAWVYMMRSAVRGGDGDIEDIIFGVAPRNLQPGDWYVWAAWLITWIPLLFSARWLTLNESVWMAQPVRILARPVLTGLLIGLSIAGFTTESLFQLSFGTEAIGAPLSWMTLFPLFSFALAMFAAWCAFQLRSPGLIGFAVFAALAQLARFYYQFGTSLMWKSMIMLCLGVVLLGVGALIQRRLTSGSEA